MFLSTIPLIVLYPRAWTLLLVLISGYRFFNLIKLARARLVDDYLERTTKLTSTVLMSYQVLVLAILLAVDLTKPPIWFNWDLVASLLLLSSLIYLLSTIRQLKTTGPHLESKLSTDFQLPTLTVAIPARNETEELSTCLRSLIANDYPKLEIIVFDDCSQNSKTPEIIRSFAHDGVRFLSGDEAGDGWLAKNWAYQRLTEEVSGQLILFCGVDTNFETNGLRMLVSHMLRKQKSMVSFMPRNELATRWLSLLIQPMRYSWEISLPRRLFNRPAVLSTCWLAKAQLIREAGGFKAVAHSIVPESYFARVAAAKDGYSFIRTSVVVSHKSLADQLATAVRTRYPQLHKRPEIVALVSFGVFVTLLGPFMVLPITLEHRYWLSAVLSGIALVGIVVCHGLVVTATYQRFMLRGLISLPFAAAADILILHYSMWQYEFKQVIWKGRNICIPVMGVISHLPKLT